MSICDLAGVEFARGLINFSSEEVGAVAGGGKAAQPVGEQLGFPTMDEVVHRWVCTQQQHGWGTTLGTGGWADGRGAPVVGVPGGAPAGVS